MKVELHKLLNVVLNALIKYIMKNKKIMKVIYVYIQKILQYSDLIGQTKICYKNDNSNSNEILRFIPGFLVEVIKGKTVVLDCIKEVNVTVHERLNRLLDKKNNWNKNYFDLPENTGKINIPIHNNFRMICICDVL